MAVQACDLAAISYFTNLALEFGKAGNTLWNFHILVTAAAVGWALASRKDKGLPWPICYAVGAGLALFHLLNLVSVATMYSRSNDAVGVVARLTANCQFDAPPSLFRELSYCGIGVNLLIDMIVWGVVVLALSPWRREPPPG